MSTLHVTEKLGFDSGKVLEAQISANDRCNDGGNFFWKKTSLNYLNYLTPDLINSYISNNADLLKLTGYLDLPVEA